MGSKQARIKKRSIRSRLTIVAIMTVFIALLVAAIALPIYEFVAQRARTQDAIESLALVVGDRSTGAIVFEDNDLAAKNLNAFQSMLEVTGACLYRPTGDLFAEYSRAKNGVKCTGESAEMTEVFADQKNTLFSLKRIIQQNVVLDGETVGSIFVASDGTVVLPRIAKFVVFLLTVLALALVIATILSARLVGRIVEPIVSLATTANRIKTENDYSLRAKPVSSHDETDVLINSFNQMIETLDQQRGALVSAKENLEDTVLKRTRELEDSRAMAESANNAKSVFLANMSHELRTPLTSIIGFRELLEHDDGLTADQREKLYLIGHSSEHLLELINDVLDFSKVEAGQIELESEVFELREAIETAMDLVAHRAAGKGIEIGYIVHAPLPELVIGDSTRLKQVLLNLLNNAIKFTEQGEVIVEVSANPQNNGNDEADTFAFEFSVRDTGIGIPEAAIRRLFKSFSQADASTTRHYGGTGLGLVICKHFVELMNGNIWVESVEGKGTTFYFSVALPAVVESVSLPDDIYRTGIDFESKTILAIDDNDSSIEIIKSNLDDWSIRCKHTNSPKTALELLASDLHFDAVLIDAPMLTRDGTSLLERISALNLPDPVPTIVMTPLGSRSSAQPEDIDSSSHVVTIHKPIKYGEMFAAILRVFGHVVDDAVQPDVTINKPLFDLGMAERMPLRILLADDHPTNQKLGAMILQQLGYSANFAWNGQEVLQALEDDDYDLVLMDLQMPVMDGLQATREIHEKWPEREISIVAMTANAIRGDRERCIAAGMEDYISKPIDVRELVRLLESVGTKRNLKSQSTSSKHSPAPLIDRQLRQHEIEQQPNAHATPSKSESESNVLDQSALDTLLKNVGGDRKKLAILGDSFNDEIPKLRVALNEGMEKQHPEEVMRAAHTIKSSARYFGATELADICANVEQQASEEDLTRIGDSMARIEEELTRVSNAISELSKEWKAL